MNAYELAVEIGVRKINKLNKSTYLDFTMGELKNEFDEIPSKDWNIVERAIIETILNIPFISTNELLSYYEKVVSNNYSDDVSIMLPGKEISLLINKESLKNALVGSFI